MRRKAYVLGAHPLNGHSMDRYTVLLAQTYRDLGFDVRVLRPTSRFSKSCQSNRLRKLVVYFEKLVLFPLTLWGFEAGSQIHVADHSDGIWLLHPALRRRGATITCHDLFAIRAARGDIDEHLPKLPGRAYQSLIRRGISCAGKIVSVSRATDSDISHWFPGATSCVVHNPLDDSFRITPNRWNGGYALIVGTAGWRKRRQLAMSAWIQLRQANDVVIPLVIVGPQLTPSERSFLSAEGVDLDEVRVKSNVPEEDLIRTYQGAQFLILASKYEGFAWPILEANALGIPVLCADEPILRETGDGNVFFDESESNDWKTIYSDLLQSYGSESIRNRALSYSTSHFAHTLREALES